MLLLRLRLLQLERLLLRPLLLLRLEGLLPELLHLEHWLLLLLLGRQLNDSRPYRQGATTCCVALNQHAALVHQHWQLLGLLLLGLQHDQPASWPHLEQLWRCDAPGGNGDAWLQDCMLLLHAWYCRW